MTVTQQFFNTQKNRVKQVPKETDTKKLTCERGARGGNLGNCHCSSHDFVSCWVTRRLLLGYPSLVARVPAACC